MLERSSSEAMKLPSRLQYSVLHMKMALTGLSVVVVVEMVKVVFMVVMVVVVIAVKEPVTTPVNLAFINHRIVLLIATLLKGYTNLARRLQLLRKEVRWQGDIVNVKCPEIGTMDMDGGHG